MTPRVIAFGEALIDCFPDRRVVAGAPLHVVAHLARHGWRADLVTRVGDDDDGARIREELDRRGISLEFVEVDDELETGRVTITLDGARHAFTIHRPAAWDAIEGPRSLPAHDAFVYGTLAARAGRSEAALTRLLAPDSDALRVFDVNLRPPDVAFRPLCTGLEAADVVKLNEDEVESVGKILGLADLPGSYFARADRLRWVCVTRGDRGAELHARDGGSWTLPPRPIEVVDTVGAGDAFTAGLVDALVRGEAPDAALERAGSFAREVVAQRGGLPDLSSRPSH